MVSRASPRCCCCSSFSAAVVSDTVRRGNLSSFFTNPRRLRTSNPKPTSKNSIPEIPHQTPLEKFLNINCKSGNINLNEAFNFFDQMLIMQPIPPISAFNLLLGAVAKIKHYNDEMTNWRARISRFRVIWLPNEQQRAQRYTCHRIKTLPCMHKTENPCSGSMK
ncbi:hypothetical protein U1Q18_034031 [Sarracenia purpurea var. burkii]